ncbi:MAG TPA: hypothetical protein DCY25_08370 [Bacteroidales bacterium]|nr:hypothetical protein [Bacteroidales bacterium]
MTIDNGKSVINQKILKRTVIILYLAFLVLSLAASIIKFPLLGMTKTTWLILTTFISLIIILIPIVLNYQYIFFTDEGNMLVFRYYSTGLGTGNKNSVEIEKRSFSGFTIDKSLFGLIQSITLYQRMKEGVAKYPPIHISALKPVEREEIIKTLTSYAPRVKGKKRS